MSDNIYRNFNELKVERIPPNKNLIRITEKIIAQNELILKMNSDLLKTMAAPTFICGNIGHTKIKDSDET